MSISKNTFKTEVKEEFFSILDFWATHSVDNKNGGFYGTIDGNNEPKETYKSVVATARILWSFSAGINFIKNTPEFIQHQHLIKDYEVLCKRAYDSLKNNFWDEKHQGVYWAVNAKGEKENGKKLMYGHSFYVYGMSEYYRATGYKPALEMAQKCFNTIINHSYDGKEGGYIEAYNEDWSETDDYILSKGISRKSMNTHLHLLECFANLYRIDKSEKVHFHLKHCLEIMLDRIIGEGNTRMTLFFSEDWTPQTKVISYGHDIEASWLVLEAAEILGDEDLIERCKKVCLPIARDSAEGIQADKGMIYEFDPETGHGNFSRDWWVMAEAMVGFYNAYQMSGKSHYLEKSENCWTFINEHLIDHENGEWYGGVNAKHEITNSSKGNPWKAPYHNARACMEIYKRIS
ncbi:AGE family epimerase/isomerase [uncultured Arcticibacterium sp.]|uniref:AGE family epimerase/isomerase n=1 Tax=uncultured Arcticibacterium sp. TaxID=2173042 RepID=UPI0030F790E6